MCYPHLASALRFLVGATRSGGQARTLHTQLSVGSLNTLKLPSGLGQAPPGSHPPALKATLQQCSCDTLGERC